MNMREYSRRDCGEPYHPDDTPGFYLSEHTVEANLRTLVSQCSTEKDRATLDFIRSHEGLQRDLASGLVTPTEHKQRVNARAEQFRQTYGDWVHHANPLYWRFYDSI